MLSKQLKFFLVGGFHTLLCIVIIKSIGWIGLLAALPFFFLTPFIVHYLKSKWERRNSLP
jgi:hypothetical protein